MNGISRNTDQLLESTLKRLSDVTARINKLETLPIKVAQLEAELSISRGKTEEAEQSVTRLEAAHHIKVAQLEAELSASRGKTEKAEESIARLEAQLSDHAAHHIKVAELEAELEAVRTASNADKQVLERRLRDAGAESTDMAFMLAELKGVYNDTVVGNKTREAALRQQVSDLETNVDDRDHTIAEQEKKLSAIDFALSKANGIVSDRDNIIAEQTKRLDTLDSALSKANEAIFDRDNTIAEQGKRLDALHFKVSDSLVKVTEVSNEIKDVREHHQKAEAAWDNEMQDLRAQANALDQSRQFAATMASCHFDLLDGLLGWVQIKADPDVVKVAGPFHPADNLTEVKEASAENLEIIINSLDRVFDHLLAAVQKLLNLADERNASIARIEKAGWHLSAKLAEAEQIVSSQNAAIEEHNRMVCGVGA